MGADKTSLNEFLVGGSKDLSIDVELAKKEKEKVKGPESAEFKIGKAADKVRKKVFERRSKKQIEFLESEQSEESFDLVKEERLETELRQFALEVLKKEKKKHRKGQMENSGPLVRRYHQLSKWYKGLEETPNGRIAQKFLESGISGSLFLGTATATGMISPTSAMWHLATRVGVATTFQTLAAKGVEQIKKKKPGIIDQVTGYFSKKNVNANSAPEFPAENQNVTESVVFEPKSVDTTSDITSLQKSEEIDFRKLKYAGIALGTSFVFLLGGWIAAAATGIALVSKEQLADFIKRKIKKYEDQLDALSQKINLNLDKDQFEANLQEVSLEIDRLTKTIKELELVRSIVKGTFTFAKGLIDVNAGLPGGGSIRRMATAPVGELKQVKKQDMKLENKRNHNDDDEKQRMAA